MSRKRQTYFHYFILILLSFIFYGNTLQNGFVLDDTVVITGNPFTQQGIVGIPEILATDVFKGYYGEMLELPGGRYRPLSVVLFALVYEIFGESPEVYHLINVLLYAITGIIIYVLISRLQPEYNAWLPLVTSVLFIIHPIHTEVVANIKSCDEILGLLLGLSALLFFIKRGMKNIALGSVLFFLALFGKENAVTFVAVIPLTLIFFTKLEPREIGLRSAFVLFTAAVYLNIRFLLIGFGNSATTVLDDPYLYASLSEKLSALTLIAGKYLQLLAWPHPLIYDYSYNQVPAPGWGNFGVIVSLIAIIALLAYAVKTFKSRSILSYAILYYFITYSIASNLFINIGTSMGERFIYFSSFGFCLAAAYLFGKLAKADLKSTFVYQPKCVLPLAAIIVLSGFKTINRNKDWKNSYTLYKADLPEVQDNVKAQLYFGIQSDNRYELTKDRRYLEDAIKALKRAVEVYPEFLHANYQLGAAYNKAGQYDSAIFYLNRVTKTRPGIYRTKSEIELANAYANGQQQFDKAIAVLEKAIQFPLINNKHDLVKDIIDKTAICYGMKGDLDKAIEILNNGIKKYPDHARFYLNLGVSYGNKGQTELAQQSINKAYQLDPALKKQP